MSRIEYHTDKEKLEDVWALLDMLEESIKEQMIEAVAQNDNQRLYQLCKQVNLLDRAQEINKKLRRGRK